MRIAIRSGAIVMGAAFLTSLATGAEHTKDTLDTVKKAMADDKAILLDVREKSEWDDGHLKGAKLLPLSILKAEPKAEDVASVIPKDKIIYCHCGVRSPMLKGGGCAQETRLRRAGAKGRLRRLA